MHVSEDIISDSPSLSHLTTKIEEVIDSDFDYHLKEKIVFAIIKLSKQEILDFYHEHVLAPDSPYLTLCTPSTTGVLPAPRTEDVSHLKSNLLNTPSMMSFRCQHIDRLKNPRPAKRPRYEDQTPFDDDVIIDKKAHRVISRNRL